MNAVRDWLKEKRSASFYLPIVLPDSKLSDPLTYYDKIAQQGVSVSAASLGPGTPLEIAISNPQVLHEKPAVPVSTVFACTAGFVSYQQGDVVLRVLPKEYKNLEQSADGIRPNRIVFGSLDPASVKTAAEDVVSILGQPVLEEAWLDDGGVKPFPDRDTLERALVQRYLAGTASIFVKAATPLGQAAVPQNSADARFILTTFFDLFGPPPPVSVPPEDFIDNALTAKRLLKFAGHPLIKATSGVINVRFQARFLIWNNVTFDYEPLKNTDVTLLTSPPIPGGIADLIPTISSGTAQTDAAGRIDFLATALPIRSMISFRYKTTGQTYGNRLYAEDVQTKPHKARQYLDPSFINTRDYKAKYEIYPKYQAFIDELAANQKTEAIEEDRGNAGTLDTGSLVTAATLIPDQYQPNLIFSQTDRLRCISAFETFYRRDAIPPKAVTFNVLFEGDSWLNYPLAFNDIFGQLDQMLWDGVLPTVSYNRIPLQHFGDRADQMFVTIAGQTRQWDFTEDFLREYQIDLIFCSAGGNDFAEPGIGNDTELEPFKFYFTDGYFDPFLAKLSLSASDMAVAETLMKRSFAILLQNHRWHSYLYGNTQVSEAAMTAMLDPLLSAVGTFPPLPNVWPLPNSLAPAILQPIGDSVIANFPDTVAPGSPAETLLNAFLDQQLFNARYADVTSHLRVLLTKADSLGIPVLMHTYGYPLFNENTTSYLGQGRTDLAGPWFRNRFREAGIVSRVVEKICLKTLLDQFVHKVLQPLKQQYPLFDYVDVRNLNSTTDHWRDEMHMRANGYRKLAEAAFAVIAANPKLSRYF